MGPDHEHVFVRGIDDAVWQKSWFGAAGWSTWVSLGAPSVGFLGGPVTISRDPILANVYVRGADNALWQNGFVDGKWRGWGRHEDGHVLASEPALASMGLDHEQVFARGTDGQVWSKFWSDEVVAWSAWGPLGAPPPGFVGGPCATSMTEGAANVYVRGTDGALWQRAFFGGTWHDWGRHDDTVEFSEDPAASSPGPEHEQVFVSGDDGQVWHKWWVPKLPTIDINLFAVGSFSARDNQRMRDGLGVARHIFSQVGLNIRTARFSEIPSSDAGPLEIIDSVAEANQLIHTFGIDDHAVDLFVVRSINGADGHAPKNGPCGDPNFFGLLGCVGELFESAENTGNSFAHELGHYLGLDPILDTDNFIGGDGASNGNTQIHEWQGTMMKGHCKVFLT